MIGRLTTGTGVSVLMSVYRSDVPEDFSDSVASLRCQTRRPDQLVVVRDGPLDAPLEAAVRRSLAPWGAAATLVELEANVGLARAMNEGLPHVAHRYVARMDADDISHRDRLARQLAFLDANQDISMLGSWYSQGNSSMTSVVGLRTVPEHHEAIARYARFRTPINHVTLVMATDDLRAVGGYPTDVGRFEDWWLAYRFLEADLRIHNLQESLVTVRGGDGFLDRRRGGHYLREEVRTLRRLRDEGLHSRAVYGANVLIRSAVRLAPATISGTAYRCLRRSGPTAGPAPVTPQPLPQ